MTLALKASFVDHLAPQAEWRLVHRVADAAYPYLVRRLLQSFRAIGRDTPWRHVEGELSTGNTGAALMAVNLDDTLVDGLAYHVVPVLEGTYRRAAEVVLRRVGGAPQAVTKARRRKSPVGPASPPAGPSSAVFQQVNPWAVEWAKQKSATLVAGIVSVTREALRQKIARGFTAGIPPRILAKELKQLVGLAPQQVDTLDTLRGRLTESGLSTAVVDKRVEFAAAKALRARVESIARTETMAAANGGQVVAWQISRSHGLLSSNLVKEWIVTPDDRLCPTCEPLGGEQVALDQQFSAGVMNPPLHPQCRCAVGLVDPRET